MNTITNMDFEYKPNSLGKKSSFLSEDSYRIFHITKKPKEESDDDDGDHHLYINNIHRIDKENDLKSKHQKKSFKISNRNGLDGWKRKSTKNKRLLFLHKTSCESTSNEAKTPPSTSWLTNDLSQPTISNDAASSQLLKKDTKRYDIEKQIDESFESDALVEAIDGTIDHNDLTLNNLLARADQLEITVKQQDFNKIQRISRTNVHRKRKRFMIACTTVLLTLIILITIIIFIVITALRRKADRNQVSKSTSVYDLLR